VYSPYRKNLKLYMALNGLIYMHGTHLKVYM
jgi:hypothetical protein